MLTWKLPSKSNYANTLGEWSAITGKLGNRRSGRNTALPYIDRRAETGRGAPREGALIASRSSLGVVHYQYIHGLLAAL